MSWEAVIRFAPATTLERLNDPGWPAGGDRLLYDAIGLKLLREEIPLLVDHEKKVVIGSVRKLLRLDSDGPWVCAIATVTKPPSWLKRGTSASFAFLCPRYCSFGNPILRSGLVDEVSVLSPGVEPAEPLARVLTFDRAKPPAPARTPAPSAVAFGHGEQIITPPGTIIRRPGIGQVLAVGGVPVRTSARQPLRRQGADYIIDHPDGSQTIYSGPEGFSEALRDGVVR